MDPGFYLKYTDIRVGTPERLDAESNDPLYPNECRLRDMTYSAPVFVDIEYVRGKQLVGRKSIGIGRMPIMLRSSKCFLSKKSEEEMAGAGECPLDPGGYFIVNGTEKVILVQEQLSKNRIIVENDAKKGIVQASVTSSTHERKSKTYVVTKNGKIYLRHNCLTEDMPIVIVLKAMGIVSDHEILLLIAGTDMLYQDTFAINFEEVSKIRAGTQMQALEYLGSKVRINRKSPVRKTAVSEAIEALGSIILAHVDVENLNFRSKAMYIAFMARRVLMCMCNPSLVDDRDYVGNKRLELQVFAPFI